MATMNTALWTTERQTEMYRFFSVAFDAAPGTTYMDQLYDAVIYGMSTKEIVNVFVTKNEFTTVYPRSMPNGTFATKIVDAVVGDSASATAKAQAAADITAALTAGMSRGDIVYQIFTNLADKPATDPDWAGTATQMANKVAVARYYTETLNKGGTDLATLQKVIANVTDTTEVGSPAALAAVISAAVPEPVVSKSLSSGVDNMSGGAGNDFFDAGLTSSGGQTLGSSDAVNGGGGADSMDVSIVSPVTVAPQLTSVETLNVAFVGSGTLSLGNSTGVDAINIRGSAVAGAVSSIGSAGVRLQVSDTSADVTFGYTTAAVSGSSDAATLTVSNVTASSATPTVGPIVTVPGVETLTINSVGSANRVGLNATSASKLVVTGDQALTINPLSVSSGSSTAALRTVDASAAKAAVTISQGANTLLATVIGGAGNDSLSLNGSVDLAPVSVEGGAGNDTITFGSMNPLTATDTISGGEGSGDTLVTTFSAVPSSSTAAFTKVSGFERLTISDGFASSTLNTAWVQPGIERVTLANGGSANQTQTVNFEAGARQLVIGAQLVGSVAVNDTGVATTDSLAISAGVTAVDAGAAQNLTIGGFESVSLSTSVAGAATAQSYGAVAITPDTGGSARLTITGSNSISIGAVTARTLDASGLTGTAALTMAAPIGAYSSTTATYAMTVTGSPNADTLRGRTLDTADRVALLGGGGNDTIYGGAGANSIEGGEGNDLVIFTSNESLSRSDVVNGGEGTDILRVEGTRVDDNFLNVSSMEVLQPAAGATVTLGSNANAAGITSISFADVGGTNETVTLGASFTNDVTVRMNGNGADELVATDYTKALTLQATAAIVSPTKFSGGASAADVLEYVLSSAPITQAGNANLTGFETIRTTGSSIFSFGITLDNATIAANKALTIDGSALQAAMTVVGTAETDGSLKVVGGAGNDSIYGSQSSYGDWLEGGSGSDRFFIATAGALTSADTVAGGAGTDRIWTNGTVPDSAFTNVSSIEYLVADNNSALTATLGAKAAAAGLVLVDLSSNSTTDSVTVGTTTNLFNGDLEVDINGADGDDVVAAATYAGALSVWAIGDLTASNIVTGGVGSDEIVFYGTSPTQAGGSLANVTKIEKFSFYLSSSVASVTLSNANVAADQTLTITGANLITGTLTVDADAETDGNLVIIGGAGNDAITGSSSIYGDNLSGGAGTDTFTFGSGDFTGTDSVSGGAGNDTLAFSGTQTLADISFGNVSSVEFLSAAGDLTATLGAKAMASGLTRVTTAVGQTSVVTVGADFSNSLRVDLAAGTDSVVATASAAPIQIRASAASITGADTIVGGTSSGDEIRLTADNDSTGATLTNVSKVETITIVQNPTMAGHDIVLTMGANNTQIATGGILKVDASGLTNTGATMKFIGTASETNGSLSVIGGAGDDTIVGTAGSDTIAGGAGADSITGGFGADVLSGGSGTDTFMYLSAGAGSYETGIVSPAVIYYGGTVASGSSVATGGMDKILDFTTNDVIQTNTASSGSGLNAVGSVWSESSGLLRGSYDASSQQFVFSATGLDTLFVYDFDGSASTGNDLYGIVLVGYVNSATTYGLTTGLTGNGG